MWQSWAGSTAETCVAQAGKKGAFRLSGMQNRGSEAILVPWFAFPFKNHEGTSRDIPGQHKDTYPKQGAVKWNSRYRVPGLLAVQSLWMEVGLYLPYPQVFEDFFYDFLVLNEGNDPHLALAFAPIEASFKGMRAETFILFPKWISQPVLFIRVLQTQRLLPCLIDLFFFSNGARKGIEQVSV
jgi:hypothetical protein